MFPKQNRILIKFGFIFTTQSSLIFVGYDVILSRNQSYDRNLVFKKSKLVSNFSMVRYLNLDYNMRSFIKIDVMNRQWI